MIIEKNKIQAIDLPFLNRKDSLYLCDFRAISESMDYKIPSIWKYENLLPWILKNKKIIVNEDSSWLDYHADNDLFILKKGKDPRISVAAKIDKSRCLRGIINSIWTPIPHPDTDALAKKNKLKSNYSYNNFLVRNNKIRQKGLLKDLTPVWEIIHSHQEVYEIAQKDRNGFIKRDTGSGGYTVFNVAQISQDKDFKKLFKDKNYKWYFEEYVHGESYSIQCVKLDSKIVVVFGFSKQIVEGGKYYTGSEIYSLNDLDNKIFLQIKKAISRLEVLLNDYVGFFGIDFMMDKSRQIKIIEANIRMTSASIPTLLFNGTGFRAAKFVEDLPESRKKKNDICLSYNKQLNCCDCLSFN